MQEEKRQLKRIRQTLYVMCHSHNIAVPWVSAVMQDISEAGMNIATAKEFTIGEVLEIKISTLLRKSQPITVLGKVVHCEKKGSGATRCISHISFTDINAEDKPIFHQLIQMFLKDTEGK